MEDSILTSVKKMLGIAEDYTEFDLDIITHINSVFMILAQIGIGPADGFMIQDKSTTWRDYISSGKNLESVRSYMALKVRLIFDPPLSSSVAEAMKQNITELEFRLNFQAELNNGKEVSQND